MDDQGLVDVCEKANVTEKKTTCSNEVIGCVEDTSEYKNIVDKCSFFAPLRPYFGINSISVIDKKDSSKKYTYRACVRPTAPGLVRIGGSSIPLFPANILKSEERDSSGMVAGCVKYYSDAVRCR